MLKKIGPAVEKGFIAFDMALMTMMLSPLTVLANETGDNTFIKGIVEETEKTTGTTSFDNLSGKVRTTGNGVYRLVLTFAMVAFIIAGAWAMFKLFFVASPQERQEAKGNMLIKLIAVIGFFAIPGLILVLSGVGNGLFK